MQRLVLDRDIRPLSDFRAEASAFLQQVRDTKRPMVITQRGRSVAVLLDVGEYEEMLNKIELLQDIQTAEKQLAEGNYVSHKDARSRVLKKISR